MFLQSPAYLAFLPIVVLVYWALPGRRWRNLYLLAVSYAFYSLFDVRFTVILFALTCVTYALGRLIPGSARPRLLVWIGVGMNLGVLGAFKYLDFFLESARALFQSIGIRAELPFLPLLLPIGISFFTFQAISYLADIQRRRLPSLPTFVDFALYLAYFPKVIAGPLIRPRPFFEELARPSGRLTAETLTAALTLFILGLLKKVLIADTLASLSDAAYTAAGFPTSQAFPAPLYWQGFYLYAFQIYADFSGYTDMARASSLLLGIALPENFSRPYWASTLGEFWNRWHMSLTGWFREFLFFPISRALLARTDRRYPRVVQVVANLITMTLIGLWHGPSWTFIGWGAWHGVWLSLERVLNYRPTKRWQMVLSAIVTFHLVAAGWILFRSSSFDVALHFVGGLLSFAQMNLIGLWLPPVLVVGGLSYGLDWLTHQSALRVNWRPVILTASVVVIVGLMVLNWSRGADQRPFIYGKF